MEGSTSTLETVIGDLDFSALQDNYLKVVGIAIPVVIAIFATKKGIAWLMSSIKKA